VYPVGLDGHRPGFEVDTGPAQGAHLAATATGVDQQRPKRMKAVVGGDGEEPGGLVGVPVLVGLAAVAVGGPLPLRGLGRRGDLQQPLLDGIGERHVQDGVHRLDRAAAERGADRTLAPDRGPAAFGRGRLGAVGAQVRVELGEHRRCDLSEPDGADVRHHP
jgi:hypothetical protein